jgi:hypothetical protein
LIENVFATTLTGLPEVPYWRAGDTLDVDCMVYDSTDMSAVQRKRKDTKCWSIGWRSDKKWVGRT